jgi:SAM-dependent methyltransferase
MFEFHKDKNRYFDMQYWVSKNYIIPFIQPQTTPLEILEVGCAEAGVLKAFAELGHQITGIELSDYRAELAKKFLKEEIDSGKAQIISKNIYEVTVTENFRFDVIILKDVIEHIHDQKRFIAKLHDLMKPNATVFFAYPPWWMPFGGHQQVCKNKLLSKLPWFHLLPVNIYRAILKAGGETEANIEGLLEIKETGIIIEKILRLLKEENFEVLKETHWLLNPIYVKKFKFKALKSIINIPYLRNIYCTAHYISFKSAI